MSSVPRYCVIGAGPCGLAVTKNFTQRGLACDTFERNDDVGGNWYFGRPHSSVCESTRLISSARLTQFIDYPMPREWGPYPSHAQVLQYLRSYAREFKLYERISFNSTVERMTPNERGWNVQISGEPTPRTYAGVVIANGHHWDPLWPEIPGDFSGRLLHAHDYKSPEVLRGQRVLVVGGGNSGCDIAVDAVHHAAQTQLSLRRGYWFLPKFLFGRPLDQAGQIMARWHAPLWLQRLVARMALRVAVGPLERYGLPRPDHRLFESHPIVNSQLLYHLGHRDLQVRPAIERFQGSTVHFVDGSSAEVDVVVFATGYKLSFPFLDTSLLNWRENRPRLFLNAFHPQRNDLFVAGMLQPDSGIWALADLQSRLMAAYLVALEQKPRQAAWFGHLKSQANEQLGYGVRYIDSPRHFLEVRYHPFRARLESLLRKMDA